MEIVTRIIYEKIDQLGLIYGNEVALKAAKFAIKHYKKKCELFKT